MNYMPSPEVSYYVVTTAALSYAAPWISLTMRKQEALSGPINTDIEQSAISWETLQLHQPLLPQSGFHCDHIDPDCISLPLYKSCCSHSGSQWAFC